MNEEKQNRLRSKVAWGAFIVLIFNTLAHFKLYEMIGLDNVGYQVIVSAVLNAGVIFGIWNNPTAKNRL